MNTPKTTIGLRLLSERKRLGLLQVQVTSLTSISKAQLHRFENNIAIPNFSSTQKLSKIGFDMDYVLNGEPQNEPATTQPLMAIGQAIDSSALTPTQKVRLDLLAKTHMGQQVVTDFLLNPTPATYELLANLEKLTQWVLNDNQNN